jgi:2-methylcitrate dehydratase PrpD
MAGRAGRGAQAAEAALLHGGLGSVFELDDLHRAAIVHPGDTVMPAALAVAQRERAESPALLDAIVRGYEAAIVVGRLAGPRHYRQWYSTATCGVFGAAAAAASLLRLSPEATADALGLAGMQASGPWQCREEPGFAKQFATGHAARSGVWAADMALGGLGGPRRILEGRHGLLAATGASLEAEPARAFESAAARAWGLGSPTEQRPEAESVWQIHDVSFKPWPACRHVHPAIEAAIALRAQLGIEGAASAQDLASIESIDIATYVDALAFADRPHPSTDHEARFSLQHAVAVALVRGDFTLADAGASTRDEPAIVSLRSRVRVAASPRFDAAYPTRFGSAVTLHRLGGTDTRSSQHAGSGPEGQLAIESVSVDAALGDPEHPMSGDALRWKAATLLDSAGVTSSQGRALIAACLTLAEPEPAASGGNDALSRLWDALRKLAFDAGSPPGP